MMQWVISNRADQKTREIADRHYNRQKIGSPQFVPPGRCVVLVTLAKDAFWVTSWPFAQYVKHSWAGAWVCSAFRNESKTLSSLLIIEALAATRFIFGDPPTNGCVTFVDPSKVRKKRDPGRCFLRAGFVHAIPPQTKGGLLAFQMLPENIPNAVPPVGLQLYLF